jgi:phosphate-selective porin OprO/OprP
MNAFIIQGAALTTAIACSILGGAAHANAQKTAPAPPVAPVRVTFGDTPSIRFGRIARVDIRLTLQVDGRDSEVPVGPDESRVSWARKRAGVAGVVAGLFGFQIEHDLGAGGQWRDVYVNYQQFDAIQVQAGKFKLPFSREQTTSPARIDFVYRSRAAETLAPGRDRGVMVHGRVIRNKLEYELGLFDHDGDNARRSGADRVYGGRSVAARVTARPFRTVRSAARTLEVGAAAVWSDVSEGLTSLKGETPFDREFYDPDLRVLGAQHRQGVEFRWRPGPFSVKSEYIRLTTERRNQSVEDTDLSPLLADGWYVSGTWVLTGERKAAGPENPRRPLPRGPGAIEAAVRFEGIGFSSGARESDDDEPSSSPRADVVRGNRLRAMTLGVNWFPIRGVRVQFNAIHESLNDPLQGPLPGRTSFWDRVVRVQFHW